jgi:hypothetical protein
LQFFGHTTISARIVMNTPHTFLLVADAVLLVHVCVALFVVGGLGCIVIGNWCGWQWVNGRRFRMAHLVAIAIIATQAWFDTVCPLTTLEMWLRAQAGDPTYDGSFVGYWLQRLLYYDAPTWVFILVYSLFALAVVAVWWYYPPRNRRK